MRHTTLGDTAIWPLFIGVIALILSGFLPGIGLAVFFRSLLLLASLWAMIRIWRYQPATEIETHVRLTTLKLGLSLIMSAIPVFGSFLIVTDIIGLKRLIATQSLLLPIVIMGYCMLSLSIGLVLLLRGNRLKAVTTPPAP